MKPGIKSPRPYEAPDHNAFLDLVNHRVLLDWTHRLAEPHMRIRFVGLRTFLGSPDVLIDELFIPPAFLPRHVGIDVDVAAWKAEQVDLLPLLRENPRLLVLGDPGSGKTTLIDYITYNLARLFPEKWHRALGALVPMPLVVRHLPIDANLTWDSLCEAWLALPHNQDLENRPELFAQLLQAGQALIMIDGIDELGDPKQRRALRRAVWEGMDRYPRCRWLLTSRLVGYDTVAFHLENASPDAGADEAVLLKKSTIQTHTDADIPLFPLHYLAPMDDARIDRFARAWYRINEGLTTDVNEKAGALVDALRRNDGTRRLMRGPLLLTLMAQIQKMRGDLPHGRIQLYDDITEGYLHTIDSERKLPGLPFSLQEKTRLLARVGFEMQVRRELVHGSVLVSADDLTAWLNEELEALGRPSEAEELVRYFSERSGLLLPRGEGQYAWMHLSFGEYFAARHLEEQITAPAWLMGEKDNAGNRYGIKALRGYGGRTYWHETLILLFERLAGKTGWADLLADVLWGAGYEHMGDSERNRLLVEVLGDEYTGLKSDRRSEGLKACWCYELRMGMASRFHDLAINESLCELGSSSWEALVNVWKEGHFDLLRLSKVPPQEICHEIDASNVMLIRPSSIQGLSAFPSLTSLHLFMFTGCDLTPLSAVSLTHLALVSCHEINSFEELAGLPLQVLEVTNLSAVSDLSPLGRLPLSRLALSNLPDSIDLSPLKNLRVSSFELSRFSGQIDLGCLNGTSLTRLCLIGCTELRHLEPLGDWPLSYLDLSGSLNVCDITSLKALPLEDLDLSECTQVVDISALCGSPLRHLNLSGCSDIADFQPLAYLQLESLNLGFCQVRDLSVIGTSSLKWLNITGCTWVTDLSPLAGTHLTHLFLTNCPGITDLSPLADISTLQEIWVPEGLQLPDWRSSDITVFQV